MGKNLKISLISLKMQYKNTKTPKNNIKITKDNIIIFILSGFLVVFVLFMIANYMVISDGYIQKIS